MTTRFRDFLKEHNAYDAYIKYNKGESDNPYVYIDAFLWSDTEEGHAYWNNLDNLWLDIVVKEDEVPENDL